jgi:hypothetical protein
MPKSCSRFVPLLEAATFISVDFLHTLPQSVLNLALACVVNLSYPQAVRVHYSQLLGFIFESAICLIIDVLLL